MLEGENNSLQFYRFCLEADFEIKIFSLRYQDQDQGQNGIGKTLGIDLDIDKWLDHKLFQFCLNFQTVWLI